VRLGSKMGVGGFCFVLRSLKPEKILALGPTCGWQTGAWTQAVGGLVARRSSVAARLSSSLNHGRSHTKKTAVHLFYFETRRRA
jgi:hypothetical protein